MKFQRPLFEKIGSWLYLRPDIIILSGLLSLVYTLCGYGLLFQNQSSQRVRLIAVAACFVIALSLLAAILKCLLLPQAYQLSIRNKVLIGAASLIVGFYVLTFYPGGIPGLHLWPNTLQVIATGKKNAASSGRVVELSGFRAGGDFVNYSSIRIDGSWTRIGNSLVSSSEQPVSLFWRGYIQDSILLFKTSPASGIVQVIWDQHQNSYDLYSPKPGEITVHDAHPPSPISRGSLWLALGIASSFCFLVLFALMGRVCSISISGFKILVERANQAGEASPQPNPPAHPSYWIFSNHLVFLTILSITSMILFLWITRNFGLWIVSDSGNYISAARHLAAGEGYIALNNDIYDWWPPLYPALLALSKWLPFLNEFSWDRLLNMVICGGTILLSGLLVRRSLTGRKWLSILVVVMILLAKPLIYVETLAMSEPLFNLSIVVFLYFILRYLDHGKPFDFFLFTGAAAAAFLTRYIGTAVVITGCIVLLLFLHGNLLERLLRTFVFGFAACLPGWLWLSRNYLLSGSLTGVRTPSELTVGQNLKIALDTILAWYLPGRWGWAGLILIVASTMAIIWIISGKFSREQVLESKSSAVLLLFVATYLTQLIITLSLYNNAAIGDRLLSPIYIPLTILLAMVLDKARQYLRPARLSQFATVMGLCLFTAVLVDSGYYALKASDSPVVTYNGNLSIYSMHNDALVKYLLDKPLPAEAVIYSNCPRCLYLFANIQPAIEFNDTPKYRNIQPGSKSFYLVWFNTVPPVEDSFGGKYSVPDMKEILNRDLQMQSLAENPDGSVYLIQAK